MRYLITLDTPTEIASALQKNSKESEKLMKELIAQIKPEASYFSTVRRHAIFLVDVKDPHVELRRLHETLAKNGEVTIDPVSTFEEFMRFVEQW